MNEMKELNTVMNTVQTGYSLDRARVMRILQLEFTDSFSSLLLSKEKYKDLTILDRYNLVKRVMCVIDSSTNKGFIPSSDLSKFPIFAELMPAFIVDSSESGEYLRGSQSMESYKWLYNLLYLTLYLFLLDSLEKSNDGLDKSNDGLD
jgi:hypothetical protein